jgi:hypothetical protein
MAGNPKISDIKVGDILIADDGFTCMKAGEHEVKASEAGALFIDCTEGRHFLAGQERADGTLIGLTLKSKPA